jgi:hypothetical protein
MDQQHSIMVQQRGIFVGGVEERGEELMCWSLGDRVVAR